MLQTEELKQKGRQMNGAVVSGLGQLTVEDGGRVRKSRDDFLEETLEKIRILVSGHFGAKVLMWEGTGAHKVVWGG